MPDFIGNEGHHGMKQPQRSLEQSNEVSACDTRVLCTFWREPRLDQFDIPVAELSPEEVVDRISSFVETVSRQRFVDGFGNAVEAGQNPAVFKSRGLKSSNTHVGIAALGCPSGPQARIN